MKDTTEKYLEYARKYIQWGTDRYICGPDGQGTAVGQAKKCVEEAAELLLAVAQDDDAGITDGIGDAFVTMVMVSERMGIDLADWIELMEPELHTSQDPVHIAEGMFQWSGSVLIAVAQNDRETASALLAELLAALHHVAAMHKLTMTECMEAAWAEIKDRKGRMVNGKFVKEAA